MKPHTLRQLGFFSCMLVFAPAALSDTGSARVPEPTSALVPIITLNVPRYMGTWYEIAKFPNRFQKNCAGFTTARYSLLSNDRLEVINRCQRTDGNYEEAQGEARQIGGAYSAKLKVRFAPRWLSFLPFVWGDYWVIELDDDYQLAAVSEPKREFLWILSRTPVVSQKAYSGLLNRLSQKGFDVSRLEITRQTKEQK
jgi:apolipoprotein D and lipocalin family protein